MANEREKIGSSRDGQSQESSEGDEASANGGALHALVRRAQAGDARAAAQVRRAQARRRAGRTSVAPARELSPVATTPAHELATYGLSVDEFKDYCKHHTQRGWDGSQAAGLVDMVLVSRKIEKVPDDVRRRIGRALLHGGDETLVMEEIGGAAVTGTRQENAERRADAAAQMERETLGNMTGGVFGAVAGGVAQWLHPDEREKIHAASGMGAAVDNVMLAHGVKGEEPRLEPPPELATYQHGSPTHSAHEPATEHRATEADLTRPTAGAARAAHPALRESVEVFVTGELPKSGPARWRYIENPEVWAPARRALHEELLAEARQQAQAFADAFEPGQQPTLYAMRGNTAAGKSRAAKHNPSLAVPMNKAKNAAINPDNFKQRLMAEGGFTSSQVHSESSMLATRLEHELAGTKRSSDGAIGNILVDKRLATVEDVTHFAQMAKATGRHFSLCDVDAPLETSLAGVLERPPGGPDPLPPYDAVGGGFDAVRNNRLAVIDLFRSDPSFGTYELFATTPSGERVKIAEVTSGKLKVFDANLFIEATTEAKTEARVTADTVITDELIGRVTEKLDPNRAKAVEDVLRKYLGKTWRAALDAHSAEKSVAGQEQHR